MFLQNLVAGFNEFLYKVTSGLKMHFADYCNLDTAIDDKVILARDGSLLTVLKIEGVNSVQPADTFRHVVNLLNQSLGSSFDRKGLIIQSVFSSDPTPETIKASLSKISESSHFTIKKLNYGDEASQLLQGQEDCLLDIVSIEKNFLCIWTTSACLTPQEGKEMAEDYVQKMKNVPNLGHGANPFRAHKLMVDNHNKNVTSIGYALQKCGIVFRAMYVAEAIHEMRMGLLVSPSRDVNIVSGSDLTFDTHTMTTSSISLRERHVSRTRVQYDGSLPRLNEFAHVDVEYAGNNTQVIVDGVYFQPTLMERMPTTITFFNYLFSDLSQLRSQGSRIPYRMLFTIASDGEALLNIKYPLATVLRHTNIDSRAIYEGAQQIKGFIEHQGVVVQLGMHILTWGRNSEETALRSSLINTRIENWGNPRLSIKTGNPIEAFASSSMGFSKLGIAQRAAAALDRALCLLPLARPTSLWSQSPIIFRSLDGKPIPYVTMADEFTYWVTFVAATPGSGKSVLANWLNTAFYLSGSLDALPYVAIIDFGFSSKGFINLLKRFLPPHQEHYAVYRRVENSVEYCVNPFELGLGLRFPKQSEIEFMVNLLAMALEDSATGKPFEGGRDLLDAMIRAAFERYSDCFKNFAFATPKEYTRGVVPEIDEILDLHGYEVIDEQYIQKNRQIDELLGRSRTFNKTSWFAIVDFLEATQPLDPSYGQDYIRQAQLAQRHASFTLHDLLQIVNQTDSIREKYKDRKYGEQSYIAEVMDRLGNFKNKFPIFSDITQFDIKDARACSFDLEDVIVAEPASFADFQKNAFLYMYTLRTATRKFFLIEDDLRNNFPLPADIVPPETMNVNRIYEHHRRNVLTISKSKKRIMVDEFHYTGKSEQLMNTFVSYMRVVRKRNMELLLISQLLEDFVFTKVSEGGKTEIDLLQFATTVFILSPQTGDNAKFVQEKLNIKDEGTMRALETEIRLPKESPLTGGSLFMWLKLGVNIFTYIVTNKLSNLCLWNFTTDKTQMALREAMTRVTMNESEAITILSEELPPFKTSQYVETMRNQLRNLNDTVSDPYDKLAEMFYTKYMRRNNALR